ncbi:hypothetical protein [Thalassoroseus pseudoceratinae]|uniref:hypothetical protein n=1 Tax=Thalassoroseus pseudoceratinae TaxID=2713176 RepID=UPI0014218E77|nr:hypothetical protein [Thalassoroseus pseudoceratinae]
MTIALGMDPRRNSEALMTVQPSLRRLRKADEFLSRMAFSINQHFPFRDDNATMLAESMDKASDSKTCVLSSARCRQRGPSNESTLNIRSSRTSAEANESYRTWMVDDAETTTLITTKTISPTNHWIGAQTNQVVCSKTHGRLFSRAIQISLIGVKFPIASPFLSD